MPERQKLKGKSPTLRVSTLEQPKALKPQARTSKPQTPVALKPKSPNPKRNNSAPRHQCLNQVDRLLLRIEAPNLGFVDSPGAVRIRSASEGLRGLGFRLTVGTGFLEQVTYEVLRGAIPRFYDIGA